MAGGGGGGGVKDLFFHLSFPPSLFPLLPPSSLLPPFPLPLFSFLFPLFSLPPTPSSPPSSPSSPSLLPPLFLCSYSCSYVSDATIALFVVFLLFVVPSQPCCHPFKRGSASPSPSEYLCIARPCLDYQIGKVTDAITVKLRPGHLSGCNTHTITSYLLL